MLGHIGVHDVLDNDLPGFSSLLRGHVRVDVAVQRAVVQHKEKTGRVVRLQHRSIVVKEGEL